MKIIQIAIRMFVQFSIVYSFLYSINTRYYTQISKAQKYALLFTALFSSFIYAILNPIIGLFAHLSTFIPIILVQKFILHYSDMFITLSNTLVICSLTCINIASHLTLRVFMMFTKNITDIAIFFTNISLLIGYYSLIYLLFFKIIVNKNESLSEIMNNFKVRDLTFVLFLIFLLAVPNAAIYAYNLNSSNVLVIIINILTIVVSVITFSSLLLTKKQYSTVRFNLEQEKMYNKTLCETVDSLRLLKHDYNNILQSINGYIITKQYDSLDEHIKKLINNTKDTSNLECISPKVINQPAIYGIVGAKYYKAKKNNIPFRIEVFEDLSSISFDSTKLSRILGILLDNAIEAAQKSSTPLVELKFIYDDIKKAHIIKIKNTFEDGKIIDINKIFEKGESSKKNKSGLGLWEVKRILNSVDDAYIYANITPSNKFEQTLVC